MTSVLKRKKTKQHGTEKRAWLHSSDAIRDGCVTYSVKLLGVTLVAQAKGTEVIKEAIKKVQFANHIKKSEAGIKASKLRKVDLKISIDNVKVEDTKTKEELYVYPLHRISYCADDKGNKKLFAFIAKDKENPEHNCYVFECEKLAEDLTLTVGQAFDLAYRRFLERKGGQAATKQVSAMEERMKAAEAEKEALKQKIEELERARNGAAVNGQKRSENLFEQEPPETSPVGPANRDISNLLGDFNGPSSQAEVTMEQDWSQIPHNAQELEFNPFAGLGEPTSSPQVIPPQTDDMPLAAPAAEQGLKGQSPMLARPRGGIGAPLSMTLPPPPSKQSMKAANRSKVVTVPAPAVACNPVIPPAPVSSAPKYCHTSKVPRRRSAASRQKTWENFHTTNNTELLDIDSGSAAANQFPVDPFEANCFDLLESRQTNDVRKTPGNMDMLDLQGFSTGLTIHHDVFGSNA